MTLLLSSDWHLSAEPRDAYRFRIVEAEIPRLILKHRVKQFLYLGDVTEAKDSHTAELVNQVVSLFHKLAELCPIVMLQANHDWLSSPDNPYFKFLSKVGNITWIDKPTPMFGDAILLPHTANPERDWRDLNFKKYKYVFAHQTFANAESDNSTFKLPGVPLSWFPKGVQIISGDVHKPQTVGPLTYVGAPYHVDFGDDYAARVLLLKNDQLTSIPITGPQKRLVEVKSIAELDQFPGAVGDLVKVRWTVSKPPEDWPSILESVKVWASDCGVVLHGVQLNVTGKGVAKAPVLAKGAQLTDEARLRAFALSQGVDDKTLKTGLKLL